MLATSVPRPPSPARRAVWCVALLALGVFASSAFAAAPRRAQPLRTRAATHAEKLRPPAPPKFDYAKPATRADALRGYQRDLAEWRAGVAKSAANTALRPAAEPYGPIGGCAEWSNLTPDVLPYATTDECIAYDSARDRLVSYGGFSFDPAVYVLPLGSAGSWTALPATGTIPDARVDAVCIYDPIRDRLVVYGGETYTDINSDTWAYDFATNTWSQLATTGPQPPALAYGATGVYDATHDRMIVYGGYGDTGLNGVAWALSLAGTPTWAQLTPSGTPPFARYEHTAIYDAPRDRMIVFSGYADDAPTGYTHDVWALSLGASPAWTQLLPSGTAPSDRVSSVAIFDAPRNRMLVFGGYADDGTGTFTFADTSDTWALALTGSPKWTKLAPGGAVPAPVQQHAAVYDPVRQRLLSFGGYRNQDRVWALGPLSGTASWSTPTTGAPMPRGDHSMAYDALRHRMIVYGGNRYDGDTADDVWTYDLSGAAGWTRVSAAGLAPRRTYAPAAFDSVRNRLIVFGGFDEMSNVFNDVWAVTLGATPAWTRLSPSGTPPLARTDASMIYDPGRDRMVVFGGVPDDNTQYQEVWTLSLSGSTSWAKLAYAGAQPPDMSDHAAFYDRPRDRMIAVMTSGGDINPVWALSFSGTPIWQPFPVPNGSYIVSGPWAVLDAARGRMITSAPDFNGPVATPLTGDPVWTFLDTDTQGSPVYGAAIFDAEHDRVIQFGGYDNTLGAAVRALTFPATSVAVTALPSPWTFGTVSAPTTCMTPGSNVLVDPEANPFRSFTGWSGDASGTDDPLEVNESTSKRVVANFADVPPGCNEWRRLGKQVAGVVLSSPSTCYDPVRHRLLAFGVGGGSPYVVSEPVLEAWELPLNAGPADWRPLVTNATRPSARSNPHAIYDPVRDRVIIGSGDDRTAVDTWALALGGATPTWSQLVASGTPVGGSGENPAIYDPVRDRVLVLGRQFEDPPGSGNWSYANDLSALNLSGTPHWTQVATTGTPPDDYNTGIYDSVRDRMVVFGNGVTEPSVLALAGTPAWSQLSPVGTPPALPYATGSVYDAPRDRMLAFGGADWSAYPTVYDNTVYALSFAYGGVWEPLATGGDVPPGTFYTTPARVPDGDRLVAFRGDGDMYYQRTVNVSYALSLGGGYAVTAAAVPPGTGSVTRDPSACLTPGSTVTLTAVPVEGCAFDHWEGDASGTTNPLSLTMNTNKTVIAVFTGIPVATVVERFVAEPADGGIVLTWSLGAGSTAARVDAERAIAEAGPWLSVGGSAVVQDGAFTLLDRDAEAGVAYWYRLRITDRNGSTSIAGPVRATRAAAAWRTELSPVAPNPSPMPLRVAFTLARAAHARLALYDVQGREVAVLADGEHAAGPHSVAWSASGGRLAAGVYLVRLTTAERTMVRRVAIVP